MNPVCKKPSLLMVCLPGLSWDVLPKRLLLGQAPFLASLAQSGRARPWRGPEPQPWLIEERPFWQTACEQGLTVGLFNLPGTAVQEVTGFMVGPSAADPTQMDCHPKDLCDDLADCPLAVADGRIPGQAAGHRGLADTYFAELSCLARLHFEHAGRLFAKGVDIAALGLAGFSEVRRLFRTGSRRRGLFLGQLDRYLLELNRYLQPATMVVTAPPDKFGVGCWLAAGAGMNQITRPGPQPKGAGRWLLDLAEQKNFSQPKKEGSNNG